MLLVLIKSCVEICGAVSSLKHCKEACVVDGVRVSNIDDLHVKLEAAMTLIPSELHPQVLCYHPTWGHQRDLHVTMRGRVKSNKRNKYNVNFVLKVVSQCVCNLGDKVWHIHKGCFPYFLSPSCWECEGCHLGCEVFTYCLLCKCSCLLSLSSETWKLSAT